MIMISLDEVKKMAMLARIELNNKEAEWFQKDLGVILDYISQLQKAPTDIRQGPSLGTSKTPEIFNVFREDEPIEDKSEVKKGEHVKVKHIL